MAGKNGNKPRASSSSGNFSDFKFVNARLSSQAEEAFKKWFDDHAADAWELLASVVINGYKFSGSWDATNDCFIFSLTCRDDSSVNANLVLTSRSDSMWEALGLCLFKHLVLWPEGWPEQQRQNWG